MGSRVARGCRAELGRGRAVAGPGREGPGRAGPGRVEPGRPTIVDGCLAQLGPARRGAVRPGSSVSGPTQ